MGSVGHVPRPARPAFASFFAAGFECTVFRRKDGQTLDVLAATAHDRFAREDYLRLDSEGIKVAREGIRWNFVEPRRSTYDFSSVVPILQAAEQTETQVIWDLCHFAWPRHIDLLSPDFVTALAQYALAFAKWLRQRRGEPGFFVPVNEISFLSWAAGEEGSIYPFLTGRGLDVKVQLVRATLEVMNVVWSEFPDTQFLHVDPVINVVADPSRPEDRAAAESYRLSQYQGFDMVSGRMMPELGGSPRHLQLIGLNYYPHNQWFYNLGPGHKSRRFQGVNRWNPLYRPLRHLLAEVHDRYQVPLFIAETGAESRYRSGWLRYVASETLAAMQSGVPITGMCLYPILNHPGWANDRHCFNGLWDYADETGARDLCQPFARELRKWRRVFESEPTRARSRKPQVRNAAMVS
jgi:beta-glucosidase/6-phospho-beta-glucosidase/beta-galactosidase